MVVRATRDFPRIFATVIMSGRWIETGRRTAWYKTLTHALVQDIDTNHSFHTSICFTSPTVTCLPCNFLEINDSLKLSSIVGQLNAAIRPMVPNPIAAI